MKSLRITDDAHEKLTSLLGELTAQTRQMQTYTDAIETLLKKSVTLPPELIAEVEKFINENKNLGYTTKEEFMREAVRRRLDFYDEDIEWIGISKRDCEKLEEAIEAMGTPYKNAADFLHEQIERAIEDYEKWKKEQEEMREEES